MTLELSAARVAVTGASGRLGNVLVRRLLERGHRVRALCLPQDREAVSQASPPAPTLASLRSVQPCHPGEADSLAGLDVEIITGSILDPRSVDALVDGVDGVYHLAARIDLGSDRYGRVWTTNVGGTGQIIRACAAARLRLVHCSSHAALHRHPVSEPLGVLRAAVWNAEVRHDKAAAELGFSPRPIADSLADELGWLRERGLLR
jgi:dihydroflavonol-4-reductase